MPTLEEYATNHVPFIEQWLIFGPGYSLTDHDLNEAYGSDIGITNRDPRNGRLCVVQRDLSRLKDAIRARGANMVPGGFRGVGLRE